MAHTDKSAIFKIVNSNSNTPESWGIFDFNVLGTGPNVNQKAPEHGSCPELYSECNY